MVSGLNASGLQFVTNVDDLQSRIADIQAELSSGLKVKTAADAPDQVSDILQLHANIQRNQQIQTNLTALQGEATTADQSLSTAATILDQVSTLAGQGLATNQTAATRQTLASQVQDLMQQMVSLSQAQVNGRFIFSGDADQSAMYQFDANSPTGVDRLQVTTSTRQAEDTNGNKFPVALTATQIFDARDSSDKPTTGNVFAAMNAVRVALQNNDTAGLETAVSSVKDATSYVSSQQGFYGTVENRISAALNDASTMNVSYQQELSNRQDADATSAIVEMQQYLTTLQAAMASEAKMPHGSLFDLLS
jgi:flagellar hook-associated protein 3 FlgL